MNIEEFVERWFANHPIEQVQAASIVALEELRAARVEAVQAVQAGLATR